ANQMAQDRDVERRRRGLTCNSWFERRLVAVDEIGERAFDRLLAALAIEIGGHGTVGDVAVAERVERGEQRTGIAVAEIGLARGVIVETVQCAQRDAARAVTATREPDGVDGLVVGGFEKGLRAFVVGAGKVAGRAEALRMEGEHELGVERTRERLRAFGDRRIEPRARSDNRDSHAAILMDWRTRKNCCRESM